MNNAIKLAPQINKLRALIGELRTAHPEKNLKESLALKYILSQYHKYNTTDQQICKGKDEVYFVAQTYLCYLESLRKSDEINVMYKGKGERTTREAANIVGFKLPHDPK